MIFAGMILLAGAGQAMSIPTFTDAAVADWFVRAERRLPAPVYEGYQRTWATVAPRADAQASSTTALPDLSLPLRIAAIRTGVWDSFARFLWRAERDEN